MSLEDVILYGREFHILGPVCKKAPLVLVSVSLFGKSGGLLMGQLQLDPRSGFGCV